MFVCELTLRSFPEREECQGAVIAAGRLGARRHRAALRGRESIIFRAPHGHDEMIIAGRPIRLFERIAMHVYEVRPRKDHRGVDLISDALPFGRLWYDTLDNAVGYAMYFSRSHNAVIRVYDNAGNVIETHEHKGEFMNRSPFLVLQASLR